jgi:hypothetical protein
VRDSRRDLSALLALGLVVAAAYVGGALIRSGGHPMFPLDDAFIALQTARQTSHLHLFEFFPGQGYMTGISSPLWALLEVPAFWIGLDGIRVILWVWALSAALWLGSVAMMYLLGASVAGRGAGLLAALLFLAHGHLAWAYFNGLETGLFATGVLFGVYAMRRWVSASELRTDPRPWAWWAWATAAALPLARPEGFVLTIAAVLVVTWRARQGRTGPAQALGWWLALAPAASYLALNWLLTGWWGTNALVTKGIFSDPYWTLGEKLHVVVQNWADFWFGMHSGSGAVIWFFRHGSAPWIGPFVTIFAVVGLGTAVIGLGKRGQGEGVALAALWYLLGTAAVCTSAVPFAHLGRYFAPYLPLLLFLAALGAHEVALLWRSRGPHVLTLLGTALVLLAAPSVIWWGQIYAENCQDIYEQHRRMSWWLNDKAAVPTGTRVAMTDVGALTYYTEDLQLCDLVGLVSTRLAPDLPRQAAVMRNGLGSIWETLERWPDRPDIVITYRELWMPPHQPELWLGAPLHAVSLAGDSITQGQVLMAFRTDWSGVGSGDDPGPAALAREGLIAPENLATAVPPVVVDELDVADLVSEAEHSYSWRHADERPVHTYDDWPPRFNPLRWQRRVNEPQGRVIWDGGRLMSGGERFTLGVEPGRPLRLVGRSDGEDTSPLRLRLEGMPWHEVTVPAGDGWVEFAMLFPAEEVTAGRVRVEVEYLWPRWAETFWHSYHWWAVQAI